eukprot:TRINITY_DN9505_c0_g1_i7.p1 TRINITY_DN9505_c0_g1~~TRINITY_DN9505_c0_g1_i7.p1  ORF type:complete len:318 (+),score=25.63 TRINITY_DN9505_c0_g1_i7:80-1033(+)
MRLDRLVSSGKTGVRLPQARDLVKAGRVLVDSRVITEPGWQVLLPIETVKLDDEVIPKPFDRLIVLNKTENCICERLRGERSWCRARGIEYDSEEAVTARQASSKRLLAQARKHNADGKVQFPANNKPLEDMTKTERYLHRMQTLTSVYDLLPEELDHPTLGSFGRLDRDTTGLFLLGSDGGLQGLMLNPRSKCNKVYRVTLHPDHPIDDDAEAQFARGIVLKDGKKCQPGKLERDVDDPLVVRVTISEGMYHQVKKMIGAVGGYVEKLHRESIGSIQLPDDLLPGQARELREVGLVALAGVHVHYAHVYCSRSFWC